MTTTETPALTALDMARNCLAAVQAAADLQASDDPEKQLLAHVRHVGQQGDQASKVAARMAVVSIAEDLHRIAARLTGLPAAGLGDEWELTGRDGDGNAVLKHKETGGRYRIIPEEDL